MVKIFLILLLASCTTTKYIDREKVVIDSVVVEQNLALQKTLHQTLENHAKEKEQWEKTGITFYDPNKFIVTPGPTDTIENFVPFTKPGSDTIDYVNDSPLRDPYPWPYPSPPTKIVFEDGKLKSVEGPVKSFNQNKFEKSSELSEARTTIDSMKAALAKKETNLEKTTVTIRKNIKTKFFPGWAYFLLPVIFLFGSVVESKFRYMQRIFSLLKL